MLTLPPDQALASNNLEKVASTMDQFERQFENLDVQSQFVEGAMNNQASLSTPEEDVNMLLQQVPLSRLYIVNGWMHSISFFTNHCGSVCICCTFCM